MVILMPHINIYTITIYQNVEAGVLDLHYIHEVYMPMGSPSLSDWNHHANLTANMDIDSRLYMPLYQVVLGQTAS